MAFFVIVFILSCIHSYIHFLVSAFVLPFVCFVLLLLLLFFLGGGGGVGEGWEVEGRTDYNNITLRYISLYPPLQFHLFHLHQHQQEVRELCPFFSEWPCDVFSLLSE